MTDLEFLDLAEQLLQSVEESCDRINDETDADLDSQRVGGMVTLTFSNRSQIVLNMQKPLHELWLAARSGGYHFKWDGSAWQDTKGQGELRAILTRETSAQSGLALSFAG
jgi:CyaY protein